MLLDKDREVSDDSLLFFKNVALISPFDHSIIYHAASVGAIFKIFFPGMLIN